MIINYSSLYIYFLLILVKNLGLEDALRVSVGLALSPAVSPAAIRG